MSNPIKLHAHASHLAQWKKGKKKIKDVKIEKEVILHSKIKIEMKKAYFDVFNGSLLKSNQQQKYDIS